jgi:rhodanese-related sulfurtransferase
MALLSKLFGSASSNQVQWVALDDLTAMLAGTANPLIIDVRGPDEFTGPLGHIDTAQNIPHDQIAAHAQDLLKAGRPLVLVCHTDRRSSAAAQQLASLGAEDIHVLRGGMVAWRAAHPA